MENNNFIRIAYSSKSHELLIKDFCNGLPSKEIKVESYLQDRFFAADGLTFYPLVICISEWLISNTGSYFYNLLLDNLRELIKGHVRQMPNNSSYQIVLGYGEKGKSFSAANVSEKNAMIAYDKFLEIASTQKNIDSEYSFNSDLLEFE
jgi:hypothetical protein